MNYFETERLIIRRFQSEDSKDLYEYLSDPMVVKYEPYEVFSEEACEAEALRRSQDEAFWAVCLKENNKLIGNLYFNQQEFQTCEIGYVFNSRYQGNGFASEAGKRIVQYGFEELKAHRILVCCNPDNTASWRLLERLSMRREGHFLKPVFFKTDSEGKPIWQDAFQYAILDEEWFAL